MQVEMRLAAAISNTVMNNSTAEDASALAAANSTRPMLHLITAVNTTAKIASAEATPRKSGTRYMRSLAMLHSTTAIVSASTASFSTNAPTASTMPGTDKLIIIPQGANSATSSARTSVSFTLL